MGKGNQPGGLPTAPAGQPGNVSGEAAPVPVAQPKPEQQGGAAAPQLTDDAVLSVFQKAIAEGKIDLTPQFEKAIQSRNDRLTNQIRKIIDTAKANGVEMTEAQAEKIAALTAVPDQPAQPAPMPAAISPAAPAQVPAGGAAADPAMTIAELWMNEDGKTAEERSVPSTVEAYRLMAAAGTRLTPDDAEINGIVVDKGQVAYLDSVKAAIAAKQARVSAQGNPGRLPAVGGSAISTEPQHKGMSGMQTLTMGINQQFHGDKP